ncbi:hypothetical protein A5742_04970 [Mycolicibacterium fortuitum]|uniref:SCP domain-containing protein n=1 Tax=Mycolicibacterium fortuitum TaxID=1766 RepID=A0ABD6QIA3_MYCFO|nr:hypothetical protein [Mycolicibacterium fortuitum]OMC39565.1 hypothetical protein A5742_04970 [Mycolicibacterium fortuitum]
MTIVADRRQRQSSAAGVSTRVVDLHHAVRGVAAAALMAAVMATMLAPTSSADTTGELQSALAAKRGGCPALQSDPVLDAVAQRANLETQAYARHTARFQPIEDPMPMLRQLSYPAGKAKLLAGFGDAQQFADPQQKAVYGATLFGWDTIPDCSYTRYGAHALTDPETGNVFTLILVVGN